jgi:serine/threonine-protein kinase
VTAETIGGRYRLERELGHGSMGEVWLARDVTLDRPVALKLLAPGADAARFDREARAAASLSHPNVLRLYDYGKANERSYMAFEYVAGRTLEARLPEGQRLPDEETADIAEQLAAGLSHAHAHGLVHRDLKPANVLFDDENRPKIADFGIASIGGGPTLTDPGTVMGTAAYISPEQADGERATPASDVYSFGVILFRMLTGRLPFEAETPLELVDMHRTRDAPPVRALRRDAPAHLAAVTGAALARNPRERPPDGAALAAQLAGDGPRSDHAAAAETLVLRRRLSIRRHLALTAAVAALLLAAAGILSALLLTRNGSTTARTTTASHARTHRTSTAPAPAPAPASSSTHLTTTHAATTTAPPAISSTPPTTSLPLTTSITLPTTAVVPGP